MALVEGVSLVDGLCVVLLVAQLILVEGEWALHHYIYIFIFAIMLQTNTTISSIIKEGLDGHVCLIGYPHDTGNKRSQLPQGQDHGPDCLRRFLPKIGPLINSEYRVDIGRISLSDYGNIYIDGEQGKGDTE